MADFTPIQAKKHRKVAKRNCKPTAAERKARRERKQKFTTIFLNGKQKRAPRPPLIEGLPVEEFLARNADSIWLHQHGHWEMMPRGDETAD